MNGLVVGRSDRFKGWVALRHFLESSLRLVISSLAACSLASPAAGAKPEEQARGAKAERTPLSDGRALVPSNLRAKLGPVSVASGKSVEELLAPLTRAYERSGYDREDYEDVLYAVDRLLGQPPELGGRAKAEDDEPRWGGGEPSASAILYIDPTCSSCVALLEKLVPLYTGPGLGDRIPLVIRPLVPLSDPHAKAAGLLMRALAQPGSEDYFASVLQIVRLAASSDLSPDPRYLAALLGRPDLTLTRNLEARLEEDWTFFSSRQLRPPLLYVRGRRIAKTRARTFAFDPAYDSGTLAVTMTLLDDLYREPNLNPVGADCTKDAR